MVIQRYNTICTIPGVMSVEQQELSTCEPVNDYCVDTSHFVPKCDAVQVLKAGDVVGSGAYDFPNGKDTGVKMPRSRLHSYTGDIAEASQNVREARNEAKGNVEISAEQFERDVAMQSAKTVEPST